MLWLSGVIAATYGVFWVDGPQSLWRSTIKTLPIALLAVAATWLGTWGLAIALALSALGDYALSYEGEKPFLIGLIAFALGHFVYVLLAVPLWQTVHWPMVVVLGLLAISTARWLLPFTGALKIPVAIYVLLICAMGVAAWGQSDWAIRLGALAFIGSDCLLALGLFRKVPHTSRPLWALYWLGQAGLFVGFTAIM